MKDNQSSNQNSCTPQFSPKEGDQYRFMKSYLECRPQFPAFRKISTDGIKLLAEGKE